MRETLCYCDRCKLPAKPNHGVFVCSEAHRDPSYKGAVTLPEGWTLLVGYQSSDRESKELCASCYAQIKRLINNPELVVSERPVDLTGSQSS
jgi:hypothetical protein